MQQQNLPKQNIPTEKEKGSTPVIKILMVDDRPENLIALERLLRHLDVELFKAESGNEALRLTLHHDFALALIDIQMPGMDGYELASLLRSDKKTSHIPFIFISAIYKDHINIFKGYEAGAFSYITKPFEPDILLNKVQFFIDKYKQEQELKETHQKLKKNIRDLNLAYDELKSFSYSVSHDLRSPLRSIAGFSEILIEDYYDQLDPEGQKLITRIVNSAKNMSTLIDDMLDFSKLGRQELYPRKVDMHQLFQDTYTQLTERMEDDRNIEFKLSPIKENYGDKQMLERLVTNLLSNAIKYTQKEPVAVIEVDGYEQEGQYVYRVRDNGAGFDELYKDKLFGVFQRLHKVSDYNGTGVGLAIAKRIIFHHQGQIWADGKVNEGATFYFTLGLEGSS
ncbi:response regulator [Fulvivirga kasyanovii]|uniref:histidine kinase n=1 Tax=Fulvivirga kasyanovii TaxID=396812 RepID=A0ABW9S0Y6_9BACT|nr:response regulator [Fulvivirga kasyanovii]MTI29150.1 hybrid sensor histidine kinase/response regulator [Fulvivirga kasyanovii]